MDRLFIFCCKSCLRGDDNKEYYAILGFDPNNRSRVTIDEIKKAYKKLSLTLHPDKLAQRGTEVTAQHKADFLKLKEAYDVLSDPKRRRLYDQIGEFGLKLIENPTPSPDTFGVLVKNFQRNRVDVFYIALAVALIFAALFVLPVLFSLKCDGDIDSVPWIALWTPMWIVNAVFLIAAIALFTVQDKDKSSDDAGDDETKEDDEPKIPLTFKIFNLTTTILFLLIQIFFLTKLDGEFNGSWFRVFTPWYLYEGVWFLSLIPSILTKIPHPSSSGNSQGLDEELVASKIKYELEYYEKVVNQWQEVKSSITIALRFWLAVFLALQLDHDVDWNWGLVLLPIWVFYAFQLYFIYRTRSWARGLISDSEEAVMQAGGDLSAVEPSLAVKYQVGSGLLQQSTSDIFFLLFPIYLGILLVSRLQGGVFSTFIIILPIFIVLGCCCCIVFGGLICFGAVDLDELNSALANQGNGDGDSQNSNSNIPITKQSNDIEKGSDSYVPPIVNENEQSTFEAYGTFSNRSQNVDVSLFNETVIVEKGDTTTASVLIEID